MLGERKLLSAASCLAVILAPLLVASLFWASYRNHASSADAAKAVTVGRFTDFILSILPPGDAVALARRFAGALTASNSKPVYVDCNAVSPQRGA